MTQDDKCTCKLQYPVYIRMRLYFNKRRIYIVYTDSIEHVVPMHRCDVDTSVAYGAG